MDLISPIILVISGFVIGLVGGMVGLVLGVVRFPIILSLGNNPNDKRCKEGK